MCYSAQIAAIARMIETKTGEPYDEALKRVAGLYMKRWTTAFGRPSLPILQANNEASLARWTFLGPWIKDEKEAGAQTPKTGVCRAEEMFEKPTFRAAARERRCIIGVEAYFEHQHRGKVKVPYRFYRPTGEVFYLGGVWQKWNDDVTFAVCTMPPSQLARWIHNNPTNASGPRQPVILRTHEEAMRWLAGGGPETIEDLIQVREDGFLVAEETENQNDQPVSGAPGEPEGRPEGVIVKGQLDLF